MNPSYLPTASSTRDNTDEPILADERRDNRIVAFVMGLSVVVSLVIMYVH
jgi:hypothetical protein